MKRIVGEPVVNHSIVLFKALSEFAFEMAPYWRIVVSFLKIDPRVSRHLFTSIKGNNILQIMLTPTLSISSMYFDMLFLHAAFYEVIMNRVLQLFQRLFFCSTAMSSRNAANRGFSSPNMNAFWKEIGTMRVPLNIIRGTHWRLIQNSKDHTLKSPKISIH